MPRVTLDEIRRRQRGRDYRFVPADYDRPDRLFAEVIDPGVIANMTLQLDLHAKHCELVHGKDCPCMARSITRTDERPMLVLHEVQ